MQKLHAHHDFNTPRANVWELLVDFGNIERWWPADSIVDIDHVDIEGDGIGMIRHIYNVGFESAVSERLDYLDTENHTLKLSIVCDRPAGLLQYQATGRLVELDNGGCRLNYDSEFVTEPGREKEAEEFLQGAYALMFHGLDASAR
ncbi:MAG: SRPBCC family protein [Gammaproteobacteria bacterium]|nr:SRPBCC family protein [Gammaproteobacteria bacterium]